MDRLIRLYSKGRLLAWPANIKLIKKEETYSNKHSSLFQYRIITAVKSFVEEANGTVPSLDVPCSIVIRKLIFFNLGPMLQTFLHIPVIS
jgi:hypothetical protein